LVLGLFLILLTGWIGSLSHTHFDGVLDTRTGFLAQTWLFLTEGIVNWLSLSVVLLAAGKLISKTAFRLIDVFGTQALARWPMLLTGLICLLSGYQRFTEHLLAIVNKGKLDQGQAGSRASWISSSIILTRRPFSC